MRRSVTFLRIDRRLSAMGLVFRQRAVELVAFIRVR
jgi:hypothetical protein